MQHRAIVIKCLDAFAVICLNCKFNTALSKRHVWINKSQADKIKEKHMAEPNLPIHKYPDPEKL